MKHFLAVLLLISLSAIASQPGYSFPAGGSSPVVVGDSGAGGTAGLVPAPAAGDAAALKFLKADGTWATTSSISTPISIVNGGTSKTNAGAARGALGSLRSYPTLAGINRFQLQSGPNANGWTSIAWAPEIGTLCAVGANNTSRVMTSTDGITWTSRTPVADNSWNGIAWGHSLFVAIGSTGTDRIMSSPDGITWTSRWTTADSLRGICYSKELDLFVAVGNGGTNFCLTSPDGQNWTGRTLPNGSGNAVCWAADQSKFVAVSNSGSFRVQTSPDGITWSNQNAAVANSWTAICYSPELNLFVSTSDSGTGDRIQTSPDGVTWTTRTSPEDNNWYATTWCPEIGLFTSAASNGTNRFMYSFDGITWVLKTPVTNAYRSSVWVPEWRKLIVTSTSSTGFYSILVVGNATPTLLSTTTATQISGLGVSGTNAAGTSLVFNGGVGTGTGAPGYVSLQYPLTTATTTATQSLSTVSYPVSSTLFTGNTSDVTVTASVVNTTETTLLGTTTGSTSLEGGILRVGRSLRVHLGGYITTSATPVTIRVKIKIGSVAVFDTGVVTPAINLASNGFECNAVMITKSVGASGVVSSASGLVISGAAGVPIYYSSINAATVNTTTTGAIDVSVTFGGNTAGNSMSLRNVLCEMLN